MVAVPAVAGRTRDGQTSVLAGSISGSEVNTISGMPGISRVPGIGLATSVHGKDSSTSQILLLITPHVVRAPHQKPQATETYLDGSN